MIKKAKEIIEQNPGLGRRELAKDNPGIGEGVFRRALREIAEQVSVDEMDIVTLAKLQQQKQSTQDQNLYLRRILRESNRRQEIVERLNADFLNLFHYKPPVIRERDYPAKTSNTSLVVQLADFHCQESIDTPYNQYSFDILGKRLEKYADSVLGIAKWKKADEIVICSTGDHVGSSRRVGELVTNSVTSMEATIKCSKLIENFIVDMAQDFPVRYFSVNGNESRIDKENDKALISNNFDEAIYHILKASLGRCDEINFIDGNGSYHIVNVNGFNILMLHGDEKGFSANPSSAVKLKKQQIGETHGVFIHYVIFGHIHNTLISGDGYARCSSMVGSGPYAYEMLGLHSDAAQNVYVVDDCITAIPINLQNAYDYEGYSH